MKNKLSDLRNHLFATIEALQDEDKPMDVARARAVAEVASTIIDTAKLEIDYAEAFGVLPGSDFVALDDGGAPEAKLVGHWRGEQG